MRLTAVFLYFCFSIIFTSVAVHSAQPVVPGTGEKLDKVGDDFEAPDWSFINRYPKSSHEEDENRRFPLGESQNGRWGESPKRGHPDQLKVVETPMGGIPGSKQSLLIRTLHSGIPGRPSGEQKQDDLFLRIRKPMRGFIPVSWTPSVVVRVYIPEVEFWEKRSHASFGFRLAVEGSDGKKTQEYWPGMFINLRSRYNGFKQDRIHLILRGNDNGNDFDGPDLQPGWVTLGMTLTHDGQVHYYASQGVDDLTESDRVASHFPYHSRAIRLNDSFFNVVSKDDGRSWSTPWIIDDPSVYYNRPGQPIAKKETQRPSQLAMPAPPQVATQIAPPTNHVTTQGGSQPNTTQPTKPVTRPTTGTANNGGVSEWIR